MPLSDDEYTCLMIMQHGENLIRMPNTRWHAPLGSLHEKGFVKPLHGHVNNFIITEAGLAAAAEREQANDDALTRVLHRHIEVNNARVHMQEKMWAAVNALSEAADIASKTMGDSKKDALRKIAHEVLERALEKIA